MLKASVTALQYLMNSKCFHRLHQPDQPPIVEWLKRQKRLPTEQASNIQQEPMEQIGAFKRTTSLVRHAAETIHPPK